MGDIFARLARDLHQLCETDRVQGFSRAVAAFFKDGLPVSCGVFTITHLRRDGIVRNWFYADFEVGSSSCLCFLYDCCICCQLSIFQSYKSAATASLPARLWHTCSRLYHRLIYLSIDTVSHSGI